ncbi:MAG: sodium:proton antiporter [Gammaproteobacteria bacterium]|nr:sodium:proton antiporter [Gammaproteobacteria bacterium]
MEYEGAAILIPTLVVFVLAILTHRPIESLVTGSLVGLVMLHGWGFVGGFAESSLRVMMDETVAWVILVCGFMGSLIAILVRTGAALSFTNRMSRYVHSQKSALFATWGLGILMFVDDYLNSIAVGSAMRSLTDRFGISREKLAYVVDSTAAPISVIIPFSTWGVFFAGLIVANGIAPEGEGLDYYISAIPYMLYAWVAVLLVPAYAAGLIPDIGPMRAAEERARTTGQTVPPEAAHIEDANRSIQPRDDIKPRIAMFLVPMTVLVAATLWFDKDFLIGIYITLGGTTLFIVASRMMDMHDTFNTVIDGFKTMVEPLGVLVAAFILKDVNDALGLAPYVVSSMEPILTPESLPVVIFMSMALVSFMTGSNWGVFVIVLPIVTALTHSLGADMTLVIGATLSASTFGSHACFYSDATVLTAQASGCTPFQHAITQIPYALIAAAITVVGYLVIAYL